LRSVRTTKVCLVLAIGLICLTAMIGASGSSTDANDVGVQHIDAIQFAHQPLSGDGSITAHLVSQQETGPDAKAGVLMKVGVTPESPYAAIMVTPGHGTRWQGNFTPDVAGAPGKAPRWLRLTRTANTVTGFESPDGAAWTQVGSVVLAGAPPALEVGMFVTSPSTGVKAIRRGAGGTESGPDWTVSTAVFDSVTVATAAGAPLTGTWQNLDVSGPLRELPDNLVTGSFTQAGGRYTLTGAGDLGILPPGGDDDMIREALSGIIISAIAIAVLGVLFMTSEFGRGLIRTTFADTPHRGRVLAAKAVVLALVAFPVGVLGAATAYVISQPKLRENGFRAPAYPEYSLFEGPVPRAILGTGAVLALWAVFAMAVGAVLRRSAGAITVSIALVVLPFVIGPFLSLSAEAWLTRLTPMAGLAIQQTRERYDNAIGPAAGLGVLGAYVVVALGLAYWQLRRRDA
jgi:hypothetical protein